MTNNVETRRLGLMSIAIVMAFAILLTGTKGSPYTLFWIYAAHLSYKGDIRTLKTYLIFLIWINAIIGVGVILFADARTLGWINPDANSQILFAIVVGIPLAVKISMLLRINNLIEFEEKSREILSSPVKSALNDKIYSARSEHNTIIENGDISSKNTPMTPNSFEYKTTLNNSQNASTELIDSEDGIWEKVAAEYDGEARRKGLFAKLFAKHNGDEAKVKSEYYNTRFNEIYSELREAAQKQTDFNNAFRDKTIDECIENKSYQEIEIYGYKCLLLHNGCAMVITPKRDMIYESAEALNRAMEENRTTGYFTNEKLVRQTYRK